jgi:hypothetical protein
MEMICIFIVRKEDGGNALGKRLASRGPELVPPESLLYQSRYSYRRPVRAPARTFVSIYFSFSGPGYAFYAQCTGVVQNVT